MFELKEIDKQLNDLQKTLHWLIDGLGVHGLKISDVSIVDWEWICENYNIEEYKYKCKHKKVSEIGYVIAFGETTDNTLEKFYNGYCNICKKQVYGNSTLKGKVIRGWH